MSEVTPPPPLVPPSDESRSGEIGAVVRIADPVDLATIAAGVLAFIFSFVAFYHVAIMAMSSSFSAWHDIAGTGFWGWSGCVVALIGAGVAALTSVNVKIPLPREAALFALFGLAFVLLLIAIFVNPLSGVDGSRVCDSDSSGICKEMVKSASIGHGFGFWIAFVLVLAAAGLNGYRYLKKTGRI